MCVFFFFQAEDGIRDGRVTGVQTCALPISFIKTTPVWKQVSRLGEPLINEVIIPTQLKDKWNAVGPDKDKQFEQYYSNPVLAKLLNQLYPQFGPFQETNRTDLVSVLLTGLKEPNLNYTGA